MVIESVTGFPAAEPACGKLFKRMTAGSARAFLLKFCQAPISGGATELSEFVQEVVFRLNADI